MAQKIFVVEGRQFRTQSDYALAKRDKEIIDKLRGETDMSDRQQVQALQKALRGGRYRFMTLLGQDFQDEVEELLKRLPVEPETGGKTGRGSRGKPVARKAQGSPSAGRSGGQASFGRTGSVQDMPRGKRRRDSGADRDEAIEEIVQQELRKREKRRRLILLICSVVALSCLGYFGVYSYFDYRTQKANQELNKLKEQPVIADNVPGMDTVDPGPQYTLDGEAAPKEVLDEYKNLLLKNKKLIGWVKIEGTSIDYPVMQTTDNEYYLDHNISQEYDKNGTIFMDKDCDVLKPSTNFILYGHHMRSGRMFGQLDKYKDESFYEDHQYISFDTIYEKGTYQVMYVFRSKVYKETEIVFKYYQFIDANGEQEFESAMEEMAALSLFDTGVTAQYGDQLLTLSTCDYQETDGRFVVVAKKVSDGE